MTFPSPFSKFVHKKGRRNSVQVQYKRYDQDLLLDFLHIYTHIVTALVRSHIVNELLAVHYFIVVPP